MNKTPSCRPEVQAAWLEIGDNVKQLHGASHFWESSQVTRTVKGWIENRS